MKLNHSNIVRYFSQARVNFRVIAFKELCERGCVVDFLKNNPQQINADMIFDFIEDFSNGMEYLNSAINSKITLLPNMLRLSCDYTLKIDLFSAYNSSSLESSASIFRNESSLSKYPLSSKLEQDIELLRVFALCLLF